MTVCQQSFMYGLQNMNYLSFSYVTNILIFIFLTIKNVTIFSCELCIYMYLLLLYRESNIKYI